MSSNLAVSTLAVDISAELLAHISASTGEPVDSFCTVPLSHLFSSDGQYYEFSAAVYHCSRPAFFVYFSTDEEQSKQLEMLLTRLAGLDARIPKLLEVVEAASVRVLLQEYPDGPSLGLLTHAGLLTNEDALSKAGNWLEQLERQTRVPSSTEQFHGEVEAALEPARKFDLLAADEIQQIRSHAADSLCAGESASRSLLIPGLSLNDIVLSSSVVSRNLVRGLLSHFSCFNWLALWEYSPALTSVSIESIPCPCEIRPLLSSQNVRYSIEVLFELHCLQTALAELPQALHERAAAQTRETLRLLKEGGTPLRRAVDPVVPAAGLPHSTASLGPLSEDFAALHLEAAQANEKYSKLQHCLAERIRALGEAKFEITELRKELELLRSELTQTSTELNELGDAAEAQREITVLKDQLAHRDVVLQSIVKSPGYRLGRAVSGAAKKVPGLKKVSSALKK